MLRKRDRDGESQYCQGGRDVKGGTSRGGEQSRKHKASAATGWICIRPPSLLQHRIRSDQLRMSRRRLQPIALGAIMVLVPCERVDVHRGSERASHHR